MFILTSWVYVCCCRTFPSKETVPTVECSPVWYASAVTLVCEWVCVWVCVCVSIERHCVCPWERSARHQCIPRYRKEENIMSKYVHLTMRFVQNCSLLSLTNTPSLSTGGHHCSRLRVAWDRKTSWRGAPYRPELTWYTQPTEIEIDHLKQCCIVPHHDNQTSSFSHSSPRKVSKSHEWFSLHNPHGEYFIHIATSPCSDSLPAHACPHHIWHTV